MASVKPPRPSASKPASSKSPRKGSKPAGTSADAAGAADATEVALRARIESLEREAERRAEASHVDAALLKIAETAAAAHDMGEFYAAIYEIVGSLVYATNCYIALYDESRNAISFPFFVDEVDPEIPDPTVWHDMGEGDAAGATGWMLRTGEPALLTGASMTAMATAGDLLPVGALAETWVGAPLRSEGRTLGLIAVQSYRKDRLHTERDLEVLTFVANHIASALARTRAIDETRQRNAELALVNEVGLALAQQLEFDAVVDLVGERVRRIFGVDSMFIGLVDERAGLIRFPYVVDIGRLLGGDEMSPVPIGVGLTSWVIDNNRPLLLGASSDPTPVASVVQGAAPESWLGVPIPAGDRVIGVVALESQLKDRFGSADERLLGTLAASMGVALENARLFDETKRLLDETDQRNAELAVVNEIGAALAKQLDFEAIIALIGERIRSMFAAHSMYIALHDTATRLITFPFSIIDGATAPFDPIELGTGLTSRVILSGESQLFTSFEEMLALGAVRDGLDAESWLGVPIRAGDRVLGVIALESLEKHAYAEGDVRLLSTVASSMGVALENARLFDETKRLLAETDERAAELALINSVQEGLSANLDMQSMYDLVGNKIQEIFDAQVVTIGIFDLENDLVRFPFVLERGVRFPDSPFPIVGFSRQVLDTGQILLVNDVDDWDREHGQNSPIIQGEKPKSVLFAPLTLGGTVRGRISLQNLDRTGAFSDSDVRLLATLAGSLSVALENARLFDETKRLLEETGQRTAELEIVNEVGQALARQLEFDAIVELVGERIRHIFGVDSLWIAILDEAASMLNFAYTVEAGRVLEPHESPPMEFGPGLSSHVIRTNAPILLRSRFDPMPVEKIVVGLEPESWLGVPIPAGDRVIGVVALESDRPNAFSEGDQRVLSTLAASMGVALENARLFDETKRLLAETDQRAAELAIITSVQDGLAAELDMQSMYDLVGDKVREIFDAQIVDIATYDRTSRTTPLPLLDRAGRTLPRRTDAHLRLPEARHRDAAAAPHRPRRHRGSREVRQPRRHGRSDAEVGPLRPAHRRRRRAGRDLAPEPRSGLCVQRGRGPTPHHSRRQPQRRPRERPPVRRDEAPPGRDGRAGGRAGGRQQRPGGAVGQPRHAGDVRARRRQDPRDLRRPGRRYRDLRRRRQHGRIPVRHRERRSLPERGHSTCWVRQGRPRDPPGPPRQRRPGLGA